MASLSVVVITYNEARNIARCLTSVQEVADEIIVLDSNSTDDTAAIAASMGAKLTLQPFLGYIEQKNKALSLASHDYVLCLDADEALDETLSAEIKKEKGQFRFDAYTMNRCTWYCGRFIRHGSWYPDRKLRLFNRHKARWGGINPHDKVEWQEAGSMGHLKGDILHYSYNTLEEHIQQNNRFSTISAEAYYQKGKKAQLWHLLVKPCWAFLSSYVLKAGFLDGLFGFIIAKNIAHLTFMKYYKLKALQEGWPVKQVS